MCPQQAPFLDAPLEQWYVFLISCFRIILLHEFCFSPFGFVIFSFPFFVGNSFSYEGGIGEMQGS